MILGRRKSEREKRYFVFLFNDCYVKTVSAPNNDGAFCFVSLKTCAAQSYELFSTKVRGQRHSFPSFLALSLSLSLCVCVCVCSLLRKKIKINLNIYIYIYMCGTHTHELNQSITQHKTQIRRCMVSR